MNSWQARRLQSAFRMIKKGDLLLFKAGQDDEDVGVVLRVCTVRRETAYLVDNGYREEMVAPKQVMQVLKALPCRKGLLSVRASESEADAGFLSESA
jgi:hypothetical protein